MCFDTFATFQHCDQHYTPDRFSDYPNGLDNNFDGLIDGPLRTSLPVPMDRFLQENDTPLFKTSLYPSIDEQTMQPFPDYVVDRRRSSPVSNGSWGSSYISSGWSDRQESPHSPLTINADLSSPYHTYNDGVPYAYGGHPPLDHGSPRSLNVCTMQEIQKCADQISEVNFEAVEAVQFSAYGTFAQEGYQPMQDVDDCASEDSCCAPPSEYQPSPAAHIHEAASPVIRRRRAQSRSGPSPVTGSRVSKRPHAGRHASFHSTSNGCDTNDGGNPSASNRAFPCPLAVYGCNSTFGSKNEWKRHVNTQHMRLGFWRCDQCTTTNSDRKPNDFNRKDLFIQHVRRMHPIDSPRSNSNKRSGSKSPRGNGDDPALQEAATRCYKALRTSPEASGCLFCDQEFRGRNTWDERLEHIGRHMENARKEHKEPQDPRDWRVDELAQNWMASEQIIVYVNKNWILA